MPNRFILCVLAAFIFLAGCSSADTYLVTASAGAGGSITPASLEVDPGETGRFTLEAEAGHEIDAVTGCGGSTSGTVYTTGAISVDCEVQATFRKQFFLIGGSVAGLDGTGLVLQNNGGDDVTVSADGAFEFPSKVAFGEDYAVSVKTNPIGLTQICSVQNAAGKVAAEVANVEITCMTNQYSVNVSVSGLVGTGTGLIVQNNGGDNLAISNDGAQSFPLLLTDGTAYSVSVLDQPAGPIQVCTVTNAAGTLAGADVTAQVGCVTTQFPVSVTVTGLTSGSVVLRNNGGDDLTIVANGATSFETLLDDHSTFAVSVASQPGMVGRSCQVHDASGILDGGPAHVWVACTNYALRFSGAGDQVDFASALPLPANGEPYTIEAWIKPDGRGLLGIAAWGAFSPNQAVGFRLTATDLSTSWWGSELEVAVDDLSHAWHHVATSWDGTTRRLFLDGVEVASDTPAAPHDIPDGRNLRLGRSFGNEYFQGAIDTVRIWGTAVTTTTLAEWRSTDVLSAHPDRADLVAAWSFREGAGSKTTDSTGKPAHQGTLQGDITWERVMPSVSLSPESIRLTALGVTAAVSATAHNEYHQEVLVTHWSSDLVGSASVSGSENHAIVTSTDTIGLARIHASTDEGAYATLPVYVRGAELIIHVDHTQTSNAERGSTWANAFTSLSDALAVAVSGDAIRVSQGTYTPSAGTARSASFSLKDGVRIYGGYNSSDTRNPDTNVTVLSGVLSDGESKSYHVVEAIDVTATLDGFTIRGGLADNTALDHHSLGAGIYVKDADLTLGQLSLEWNQAGTGGAIYAINSDIDLSSSYVSENTATTNGGGLSVSGGSLVLSTTTFDYNRAGGSYNWAVDSGFGGALHVADASSLTLTSTVFDGNSAARGAGASLRNVGSVSADLVDFQNNTATYAGGGLDALNLSGTLDRVRFLSNTAFSFGGGVYLETIWGTETAPVFSRATFDGNLSPNGGGMRALGTTPIVKRSVFRNNTASQGGAVALDTEGSGRTSQFINVAFSGNTASLLGGAISARGFGTRVLFANVTFAGNHASSYGGAISHHGGILSMQNSIMWDNRAGTGGPNIFTSYATREGPTAKLSIADSLLSGGCEGIEADPYYTDALTCTDILTADPLFVLSPVGPDGLAGTGDDVEGDLQLQAGSPALDVGDNTVFDGVVSPVDLAGNPRIVNGVVDLGAFERQ